MKKSFFSLLMAVALPMTAWCNDGDTFTAETQEGAVVTYRVLSESAKTCQIGGVFTPRYDLYVAISNYTGDVTIPAEVNGYTVTLVKRNAFGGSIEEAAFRNGDIKHLNLPASATLSGHMFTNCNSLESIDLPEGITALPKYFFGDCKSPVVESFVIPVSVTSIGDNCFEASSLELAMSHIEVPFSINNNTFISNVYEQTPLYVPDGTEESYKTTAAWSQFYGIYPNSTTGINPSQRSSQPETTARYTLDGRKAAAGQRGLQVLKKSDGTVVKTFVRF